MKNLAARLTLARERARLTQTQLAKCAGVAQSTIGNLESGTRKTARNLAQIAAALGVTAEWLATGRGDSGAGSIAPLSQKETVKQVPVISWVEAGSWARVGHVAPLTDPDEWMLVPPDGGPNCFGLRVRGESMRNPGGEPTFSEGDRVVVDPDREATHRSFVVVVLNSEDEATFKQLIIEGGKKYLKALNPAWPTPIMEINGNATICGVVISKLVRY